MIEGPVYDAAQSLLSLARANGTMITTAESCTGGLVAASLTAVAGSSDVVAGGFVTYSNAAKMHLGVDASLLATHGAVSEEVARALALSAARQTPFEADRLLAVSVTGVAGPGGGSPEKPVGLVHFGLAERLLGAEEGCIVAVRRMTFGGIGRGQIRADSVLTAFQMLTEHLAP